jgi:uridine kinase
MSKGREKRAKPKEGRLGHGLPMLVAIVGGSGSGKSWLADKLAGMLGRKAARLSLDDFYRDRSYLPAARRARINYDHPRAIDWLEAERVLRNCAAGRPTLVPSYDFGRHSRLATRKLFRPRPIILVEGLWLLRRRSWRGLFGVSLYLDCPAPVRLARRLARDLRTRARTRASVLEQFKKTVEPMHRRFVEPQARLADVVLRDGWGKADVGRLAARLVAQASQPAVSRIS